MNELKILIELVRLVVLLIIWIFRVLRWLAVRLYMLVRGKPAARRAEPARLAPTTGAGAAAQRPAGAQPPQLPAPNPVALQQLQKRIDEVATRARTLLPRLLAQPLCRGLVP